MGNWAVGIDIGGTFTDIVAVHMQTGEAKYLKTSSTKSQPAAAVLNGIGALRDEAGISPQDIMLILHGTTIVTNAIIERTLAKTALVTTEGFGDVLELGRTWREELYDPFYRQKEPIVPRNLRFHLSQRTGADGSLIKPLEGEEISRLAAEIQDNDVEAVAVALLQSFSNPEDEETVERELRNLLGPEIALSVSSSLMREVREYERTATTVLNASLIPKVKNYMDQLERGLAEVGTAASLYISQSNGGMQPPSMARERPVTLALSGPVAGVVALGQTASQLEMPNLIGIDVGGTSADVSLVTDFEPRVTTELSIGELPIRLPSVKVDAIGAGGGSIVHVNNGVLRVGPESAGSEPGPVAYGQGGVEPTITDCHLVLGRFSANQRLAGRLSMDGTAAAEAVNAKLASVLDLNQQESAAGAIQVVNASMEGAIRVALRERGDDPRSFGLAAFGGGGALHACELARSLGIPTVVIPPHPGTICAEGLLSSDIKLDASLSDVSVSTTPGISDTVQSNFASLERELWESLETLGWIDPSDVEFERFCDVRYAGQAYEVLVPVEDLDTETRDQIVNDFHALHQKTFGFSDPEDTSELVTYRVTARVRLGIPRPERDTQAAAKPAHSRTVYELDDGPREALVYQREGLAVGTEVQGPAILEQVDTTVWLPSYTKASVHESGTLIVSVEPENNPQAMSNMVNELAH